MSYGLGLSQTANLAYNIAGSSAIDGGGGLPLPALRLDASVGSTITSSAGLVSAWADVNGNGVTVTQGTSSAQPTTGVYTQNLLNCIYFDGGDFLLVPSSLYTLTEGDLTIVWVAQQHTGSLNQRILSAGISGSSRLASELTAGGDVNFYNNASFDGVLKAITETQMNIVTQFRSGATQSIQVNNGTATTDSAGAAVTGINQFKIGSNPAGTSLFFKGWMCEVIFYDKILTTAQLTTLYTQLNTKWITNINNLLTDSDGYGIVNSEKTGFIITS